MSIRRETSSYVPKPEELVLVIDNGDLKSLKDAVEKLEFKDEESLVRFALAVLAQSATRIISITLPNGSRVNLNPSVELLKLTTAPSAAAPTMPPPSNV